jgi:hypothetical protein
MDPQDDFFTEEIDEAHLNLDDQRFAKTIPTKEVTYEGQIADRMTEDNFETSNLMDVSLIKDEVCVCIV